MVFSEDGRVHHLRCPKVSCPVCSYEIQPSTPIRREGELLFHGVCWERRERQRLAVAASDNGRRAELVRARIAARVLPSWEPNTMRGRSSAGSHCSGCDTPISAGQVEYELVFANAAVLRLHRACYLIWQEERGSVKRAIGGSSATSPWTLLFDESIARRASWDRAALDDLLVAAAETVRATVALRERRRATRLLGAERHERPSCAVSVAG